MTAASAPHDFFFPMHRAPKPVRWAVRVTDDHGACLADYEIRATHRYDCYDHALEHFPRAARIYPQCLEPQAST